MPKKDHDSPYIRTDALGVAEQVYQPGQLPNRNLEHWLVVFDTGVQLMVPPRLIGQMVLRMDEPPPPAIRCVPCEGRGKFVTPAGVSTCLPCKGSGIKPPSAQPEAQEDRQCPPESRLHPR